MCVTVKDSGRAPIQGQGHEDTSQKDNGCDKITRTHPTSSQFPAGQSSPQFVQEVVLFISTDTLTCTKERVLGLKSTWLGTLSFGNLGTL